MQRRQEALTTREVALHAHAAELKETSAKLQQEQSALQEAGVRLQQDRAAVKQEAVRLQQDRAALEQEAVQLRHARVLLEHHTQEQERKSVEIMVVNRSCIEWLTITITGPAHTPLPSKKLPRRTQRAVQPWLTEQKHSSGLPWLLQRSSSRLTAVHCFGLFVCFVCLYKHTFMPPCVLVCQLQTTQRA